MVGLGNDGINPDEELFERTPGLEEYIEALSFMWYLQHGGLVPLDNVQKALSDENGEPVSFRLLNSPPISRGRSFLTTNENDWECIVDRCHAGRLHPGNV